MTPRRDIAFTRRRAGLLAGVLGLLLLVGYSLYVALPYLEGPYLTVSVHLEHNVAVIEGRTARVSYLQINGDPVALSEDGSFSVRRAYPLGYTAITIAAKDRFGREITKILSTVNPSHGS